MRPHKFHSAENRPDLFAGLPRSIWLEKDLLRSWTIIEPSLVLEILHSPHAVVPSAITILNAIEKSRGLRLPHMAYACGVLPLMVEDSRHVAVRRGFATFLAARLGELQPHMALLAKSCLKPLSRPGSVDIYSEVVGPFLQGLFTGLLQCNVPSDLLSADVGDILSFNTNLAGLQRLDASIGKTLSFLRETTASDTDVGWKFCCFVFGVHSVTMMLTEGIVTALRGRQGSAGARLPEFPIETGAPVVFRRARNDFEVWGCPIIAGDMIRLQMQPLGYSDAGTNRSAIFGAGVHSCVGKQMSLSIWRHLKREFDQLNLRARIARYDTLPADYVTKYRSVELEVL